MNIKNTNLTYWLKYWEEKSRLQDSINVSGWGSKDIREYLYDIRDICEKLKLCKKDSLLNIGCGNGLMEIFFSYLVKTGVGLDFSEGMLKKARDNNKEYKNIKFFKGDILDLGLIKNRFNKVLCNSVIQYLDKSEDIEKAFREIKKVTTKDAFILISANPDKRKLKEYIAGYDKLSLKKEDIDKKKKATSMSLWTDPFEIKKIAESLSYKASIENMNKRVWQSWYMYDLILRR